jgi:tripartite-type tricarboxylate transporter receptor subunit TctC
MTPVRIAASRWLLLLLCALATAAWPQDYPVRPVRNIIGFPPGGAVDLNARMLGEALGKLWGQPVLIENKGGAGSTIGAAAVAQAPADGYTYLMVSPAHAINATLYRKLPYDTETSFAPVTQVVSSPLVLYANPSLPANNVRELIALAKAKPHTLNFGFGGNGTSVHLASVLFNQLAGTDIVYVPYQGGGPTLTAILADQVQLMFGGIEYMNYVQSGKMKALAVTTLKRAPSLPNLPTVAESGVPGFDVEAWYGIYLPAGTPATIVNKLNRDIVRVIGTPEMMKRYTDLGFVVVGSSPEQFAAFTRSEIEKWRKVIRAANITAD